MTQEDKELLLKDLCARLPYGVKIYTKDGKNDASFILKISDLNWIFEDNRIDEMYEYDGWKPYLRPMSSMTEEEDKEYTNIDNRSYSCPKDYAHIPASDRIDWLNAHHFDYRGLIEQSLALEAPEWMYKTWNSLRGNLKEDNQGNIVGGLKL